MLLKKLFVRTVILDSQLRESNKSLIPLHIFVLIIPFRIKSTNSCMSCGVKFADYHCSKCNLWMDLSKKPFHCDKCGICRVGGKDNFSHCDQCCMCISVSVIDTHNCLKDKYKSEIFFGLIFIYVDWQCLILSPQSCSVQSQLSRLPRRYVFFSAKPSRVTLWTCYSRKKYSAIAALVFKFGNH